MVTESNDNSTDFECPNCSEGHIGPDGVCDECEHVETTRCRCSWCTYQRQLAVIEDKSDQ